jgi:hypothetical protein
MRYVSTLFPLVRSLKSSRLIHKTNKNVEKDFS